jgi:hypothetical protein
MRLLQYEANNKEEEEEGWNDRKKSKEGRVEREERTNAEDASTLLAFLYSTLAKAYLRRHFQARFLPSSRTHGCHVARFGRAIRLAESVFLRRQWRLEGRCESCFEKKIIFARARQVAE